MTTDNFYQFPIAMLGHGKPITEVAPDEARRRCQDILLYCIWDVGYSLYDGDEETFREMADRLYPRYYLDEEDGPADWEDEVVWVGAETLGLTPGAPRDGGVYQREHRKWKSPSNGRQQVRIRNDILHGVEGGSIEWRDFAILASIYCAIGGNKYLSISISRLNAMSLGFNSLKECRAVGKDNLQLTDRQVRRTVDKLAERGWFCRMTPNKRHMFYSNKLTPEQLFDELVTLEVKRATRRQTDHTERLREAVLRQLEINNTAGK